MCIPLAPWMCIPDSLNHKFRMFSSPELDTFLSGTPSRIFALMRSQSTRIHSYHISLSYHLPRITRQARYVTHSTLNSLFLQERNMLNRLCHKVCIHAFQSSCNGEDCSLARTISLSGLKHSLLHILSMRSSRRLNNSYWRIVSTSCYHLTSSRLSIPPRIYHTYSSLLSLLQNIFSLYNDLLPYPNKQASPQYPVIVDCALVIYTKS